MRIYKFIKTSFQCIKLFCHSLPGTAFFYILGNVLYAIMWMLQTVSLQLFFDLLESERLWLGLCILGITFLVFHVLDGITNGYSEIVYMKLVQGLNDILFHKTGTMKAIEFEESKRLTEMEKAKNGANCIPGLCMTVLDILFCYALYFVFIGWYLFSREPYLVCCIIAVFLPVMISKLVQATGFSNLEAKEAPLRRMENYYEKCLTGREFLKETRILGASTFFMKRFENILVTRTKWKQKIIFRKKIVEMILKGVTACGYGVIVWMLFYAVMQRKISIGVFAAVLSTIGNMFRFMDKMVSERLGWATEHIGLAENYLTFVNESQIPQQVKRCTDDAIVLHNVCFRYPNGERNVLENINLKINPGETVALVGENGSGKTTLARILMGLYEPTEGTINCGEKRMSAVFQKFCKYQMTLRDNLTISDGMNGETEELIKVCEECGIELKNGINLDSMLGREFKGTDLSGGQWQRIAIARGIYRKHEMIILDEPTAAIDPLEEARIYQKFADLCKKKIAVLITHRMGAAKIAARILVMQKGKIVEEGTHKELMQKEGLYYEMYNSQKQWYDMR